MKVCTVSGVQIHLNNIFLALLGLFFVAGVLAKGLIAFSIVLLHELAHVAAARRLGVNVADVELLPFGGVCRIGGEVVLDPAREVLVASAGPGPTASRLGRSAWPSALTIVTVNPLARSRFARKATMAGSPAAPSTRPGFTLSIATRSDRSATAASPRSSIREE